MLSKSGGKRYGLRLSRGLDRRAEPHSIVPMAMYRAASTLFIRGGVVNQELGDVFSPGSLNQISTWARWLSRRNVERRDLLINIVCNKRGCACHSRIWSFCCSLQDRMFMFLDSFVVVAEAASSARLTRSNRLRSPPRPRYQTLTFSISFPSHCDNPFNNYHQPNITLQSQDHPGAYLRQSSSQSPPQCKRSGTPRSLKPVL